MKEAIRKIVVFCLIIIICSSSLSCNKERDLYTVLIDSSSKRIDSVNTSNYDEFLATEQTFIDYNASKTKTENILNIKFDLHYDHSIESSRYGDNLDYYHDDNANYEVGFSRKSGKITRILSQGSSGKICSYPNDGNISESDYIDWLKKVIKSTLNMDVSNYTVVCRTMIKGGSTKDYFMIADKSNIEQVSFYSFEFFRYFGGLKCGDMIRVLVNPDFSIQSMVNFDVDSNALSSLMIDNEKVDRTIENTVKNIVRVQYTLESYSIRSKILDTYNEKPIVMCGIELVTSNIWGEEMTSLIILVIEL